jgi:galactose mutarotase-like enzyme
MATIRTGVEDGFDTVVLDTGAAEVTFVPALAMLGASFRHLGAELLATREGVAGYARGRLMGIPLLHPWANRLADASAIGVPADDERLLHDRAGLPMHGLRPELLAFRPADGGNDLDEAWLSAVLEPGEDLLRVLGVPHRLTMTVRLRGAALSVATTIEATGDRAVPVAFGFHPYLRLPGSGRDAWRLRMPAWTGVELDARSIPTGRRLPPTPVRDEPLGDRAFDHGYVDVRDGDAISVTDGERRLTLTWREGFPAAQVYAPSDEDLLCPEPMTAPTNALTTGEALRRALPGQPMTAVFSLEAGAPD